MLFVVLISFGQEIRTCGLEGESVHRHYFRSIHGKVHGAVHGAVCGAEQASADFCRVAGEFFVQLSIFKY
jgi:hypothetical protein